MNFAVKFPFFLYYSKRVKDFVKLRLCETNTGVFFFRSCSKRQNKTETELCESGNVFIVLARKMCNIRFSDGSRFQRRTPIFNRFFYSFFVFSSQFLRSLDAFWSWGRPGNLRTHTNAPEIQNDWILFWSRLSFLFLSSPLFFLWQFSRTVYFCLFCFCYFQVNTLALTQVPFFLASFCIIVIYCTCNELVSIATFNSRSFGSRMGLEFLTYKNYRSFLSKPKCVFHQ